MRPMAPCRPKLSVREFPAEPCDDMLDSRACRVPVESCRRIQAEAAQAPVKRPTELQSTTHDLKTCAIELRVLRSTPKQPAVQLCSPGRRAHGPTQR